MGNHNDPIREGIENFVEPVTQMFRNIGNISTNISDTISDLGDAVSKSKNESASGADNVERKGGCLKPILYLIAIALLFSMCGTEEEYDPASDIAMVQSGYLGEYTDVPVQELLWFLYSNVSDSQEWEGFICDDGYPIVQVTYSRNDEPDSPAIFQFSIADQQFVLSGYRDTLAEVEEITDLYALLNYTYLEWRSQNYSGDFPYDPSLIDELNDISGSSIMYGASKSYTGDRSTLNQDYGEELLPLSVPWLLDNYGYIDMAMYPEVPYNEQAFGGNIETSQGTQTELHLLDNLLAYAEKYDIELFRFEEEQNLAQWLETLDQELAYVQEDNIFGAPRYKRTEDRSHYVYCGELQENQPNGYGILFGPTDENDGIMSYNEWSYDILYIGKFKDGRYEGFGLEFCETNMGESYLSRYCTAEQGTEEYREYYQTWANPVVYFGEFQSGERHGKGNAFVLAQAEIYFGAMGEIDLDAPEYEISVCEYRSDERDGNGTIYAPNGYVAYVGGFDGDEFDGYGKKYYYGTDTLEYEGDYKDGNRHGTGTSYEQNGDVAYSGEWAHDDYK